jgi:hypothetical protein
MRNNLNYQSEGALFQTIQHDPAHTQRLQEINEGLKQYSTNVEQFKTLIIADREKHTYRRN